MKTEESIQHLAIQISRIYEILISLTERLDEIEQRLCVNCNKEKKKESFNVHR
jgi:hypothetical protein